MIKRNNIYIYTTTKAKSHKDGHRTATTKKEMHTVKTKIERGTKIQERASVETKS